MASQTADDERSKRLRNICLQKLHGAITHKNRIFLIILVIPFISDTYFHTIVGQVAQSVQRLTMGWMVRGSNPGVARFSASPNRPWGPPSLL